MAIKVHSQPSTLAVFWLVSLYAQVTCRQMSPMGPLEKVTHHQTVCHSAQQDPRDVASPIQMDVVVVVDEMSKFPISVLLESGAEGTR